MSAFELESLRSAWSEKQQQLDASINLDLDALRQRLRLRSGAAFRRHQFWLLLSVIGAALASAALLAFLILHREDSVYCLLAAPLAMLAIAELIVDLRQWRSLAELDLAAPVTAVQTVLDGLRDRSVRLVKWVLLSSVLLWLPALLVLCKGLFAFDLLDYLHPSVLYVNMLAGLLFIPVALALMALVRRFYRDRPGYAPFLDELVGSSWHRARRSLDAQQQLDQAIAAGAAQSVLAQGPGLHTLRPLNLLRRRLRLSIAVAASLVLVCIAFNLAHGAQAQFLLPALLLHFFGLTHMVVGILQHQQLRQLAAEHGPPAALRLRLKALLHTRAALGRWTLVALPLLLLPLAQVLGKAWLGLNIWSMLSAPILLAAFSLALGGSLLLRWQSTDPQRGWIFACSDALVLGTLRACRALIAALPG